MRQENFKKEVENGNKESSFFQDGTFSFERINIQHVFTWNLQKHVLGKTNLDFPNQIHANSKISSYLKFCGQIVNISCFAPDELI